MDQEGFSFFSQPHPLLPPTATFQLPRGYGSDTTVAAASRRDVWAESPVPDEFLPLTAPQHNLLAFSGAWADTNETSEVCSFGLQTLSSLDVCSRFATAAHIDSPPSSPDLAFTYESLGEDPEGSEVRLHPACRLLSGVLMTRGAYSGRAGDRSRGLHHGAPGSALHASLRLAIPGRSPSGADSAHRPPACEDRALQPAGLGRRTRLPQQRQRRRRRRPCPAAAT